MLYILIAVLSGVCIVVARTINSNLAIKIGTLQGTFFNNLVGLLFSFMFLLLSREALNLSNINLASIPFWAYLGGILGVLVVVVSNYITPKVSAFYLTFFTFIGQLFVGIIIDYFALNELSIGKIIGGFLVLLGLTYNLFIDKKSEAE